MTTNNNTINALQDLFTALQASRSIYLSKVNEYDLQVLTDQAGMDYDIVCERIFDNISDAMEIIYGVLSSGVDGDFVY